MGKHYLYIVLTRTNTIISKLIHFVKRDEYTHAAIAFDKRLNHMYGFSRKYTYNPFVGGFRKEDIHKGVYNFSEEIPGVIIEIEVSKEQYKKSRALLAHFIFRQNEYKYNYMGIVDNLFHKEACHENRYLCSEFVYHVLKECGIVDFKMSGNLVRPVSLLEVEGKVVYKGNLKRIFYSKQPEVCRAS